MIHSELLAVVDRGRPALQLPRRSIDYLERTEKFSRNDDAASLMYAAHAVGISKKQARDWNIDRSGRTLESVFGAGNNEGQ